jgi:hypothetical protein
VNLWMKRAIGVAALGGGLLALGAGSASAREVSADALARVGRSTSAEVRVCADGRVLSRLLGGCGQASSGGSVQAGRGSGSGAIRARARVPRLASADVSIGRSRPAASASGQASATRRHRPGARRRLRLDRHRLRRDLCRHRQLGRRLTAGRPRLRQPGRRRHRRHLAVGPGDRLRQRRGRAR